MVRRNESDGECVNNDTDVDDAGDTKNVSGVAAGTVASASTYVGSSVLGGYTVRSTSPPMDIYVHSRQ